MKEKTMAADVAFHVNILVADIEGQPFVDALTTIADAGYASVVLPPLDPDSTDVPRLVSLLTERGLEPITIAVQWPGVDVSSASIDERRAGIAHLKRVVQLTGDLGGRQMNGVPYGVFGRADAAPTADARAWSAEAVGTVADLAHNAGIQMTFEVLNRYETAMINTAAQAVEYVALSGSDHLKIHLDTFHMAIEESNMLEAISHALPSLGYLELGQSSRGSLASGVVDVAAVVRHARSIGYTGRYGVEAFSSAFLSPEVAGMLAIWGSPFTDGAAFAVESRRLIESALA
jgi:D-psicose/D-tagatose/L-ribulose 3-epimerase